MKFKELPEGLYQITQVNQSANTVFVMPFENPEGWPLSIVMPQPIEVVHDGRSYNDMGYFFPKNLDQMDPEFKSFGEVKKERKSYSARLSHITRGLQAGEPLTGKTLELALSLVTCDDPKAGINSDPTYLGIAKKLREGLPLSDYETHLMVDVRLVHERF
jgi:hypothetical protein